jgi:hypothetical protein
MLACGRLRLLDAVHDGRALRFGHMDRAAADDRAAAGAGAQFSKGHPNGHMNTLFVSLSAACPRRRWSMSCKTRKKALTSTGLTTILKAG